jgi:class 3 adenylate cyclase
MEYVVMPTMAMPDPRAALEHLVLAIASVDGATAACATHGDAATVAVLSDYYALVAEAVATAGGRVVKVMGDGVLMTFPADRARDAVAALRTAQAHGTDRWKAFDARCAVVVKAGAGPVLSVPLGPPGEERPDVYGDVLNRLMKSPHGTFMVTPELTALLDG